MKVFVYTINDEHTSFLNKRKDQGTYLFEYITREYKVEALTSHTDIEEGDVIFCHLAEPGINQELENILRDNASRTLRIMFVDECPIYSKEYYTEEMYELFDYVYHSIPSLLQDKDKSFVSMCSQRPFMWSNPRRFLNPTQIHPNFRKYSNKSDSLLMILNNKAPLLMDSFLEDINIGSTFIKNLYRERTSYGEYIDNNFKCDIYGDAWWNLQNNRGKFLGDRMLLYRSHKFCLIIENCQVINWMSEKMLDAMTGGCVPIYKGSPSVASIFPDDTFVNVDDFSDLDTAINYAYEKGHEYFYQNIDKCIEGIRKRLEPREYFLNILKLSIEGDSDKIRTYMRKFIYG